MRAPRLKSIKVFTHFQDFALERELWRHPLQIEAPRKVYHHVQSSRHSEITAAMVQGVLAVVLSLVKDPGIIHMKLIFQAYRTEEF